MSAKAYSYARFSSRAQAEGDSLRRQLSAAYAYAEKHGLELDTSLRDLGVSGFSGANRLKGALKSFNDRVESGDITRGSYLLIDSLDRLSRENIVLATHQLLGIALAGINVVTLNDERIFAHDADMGTMMLAVVEIERSHRESAEKGRKVFAAHTENKRKARENGRVWTPIGPSWLKLNRETGQFEQIPEKVATVRRMFDLFESGLTTTRISEIFNGKVEGQPPEPMLRPRRGSGNVWGRDSIFDILNSRHVIGEYQPYRMDQGVQGVRTADGPPIPNYYSPAPIEEAQFYRVAALLEQRRKSPRTFSSGKEFNNLFIGLCKCWECGGTVGLHINKNYDNRARTPRLRCVSASRGGKCNNKVRYRYAEFESAFLEAVTGFDIPGEQATRNPDVDALALAIAQRDELDAKANNMLEHLASGDARMKRFYDQLVADHDDKMREVQELQRRLQGIQAKPTPKNQQQALSVLRERVATSEDNDLYALRASLHSAIKGIVDLIDFDPNGDIRVIVGAGVRAYRFRDGALFDSVDFVPDVASGKLPEGAFTADDDSRKARFDKLVA